MRIVSLTCAVACFLVSCSSDNSALVETSVRLDSVQQIAQNYGAQSGLEWQSNKISQVLQAHRESLASIYDFRSFLIDAHILPPVLQETKKDVSLSASENTLRISDMTVEITQPARFVTAPPVWYEYIQVAHATPNLPQVSLLPQNQFERDLWDEAVVQGWTMGVDQANEILMAGIHRLNRDFLGMVLFHRLYEQGLVSRPFSSKTELGITGNSHKVVVGDQVVRMSQQSELLVDNSAYWEPLVVKSTDALSGFSYEAEG
ncbi:MAG: hypothetical protein CMF46_02365 [Legionellales bacterium]|nr:hypothetical protein [Legionellales bacterium]|tara:strand:+ start:303 stop:1082 length:780 start_codon:yes stop_codon:yes gene_type:complete